MIAKQLLKGIVFRVAIAAVALGAFLAASAGTAHAALEFDPFTAQPVANAHTPDPHAAGSHPDFLLDFSMPQDDGIEGLKTVRTELPRGLVLNPRVVDYCTAVQYSAPVGGCPTSARLGIGWGRGEGSFAAPAFLYALKPREDEAARVGMRLGGTHAGFLTARVTPEDGYVIKTELEELTRFFDPMVRVELTLAGIPADITFGGTSGATPAAALTYPTSCSESLITTLAGDSYQTPGVFDVVTATTPPPTSCEAVPFTPSIDVHPDSRTPGAPSGYSVELTIPQSVDPDQLGQAHLRDAVVTLPEGVSLSPSAADGLTACSDARFGIRSDGLAECPESSKIGTASVETPLLEEPLHGSIYVGSQVPGDPYRVFIQLKKGSGKGVLVKLQGSVRPDPQTGQLTTTFEDNPQLPFSKLSLRFKGGPRAPLANPSTCGEKTVTSVLTPWSGNAPATPSDTFTIDCPAPSGFTPDFDAGMVGVAGGSFSPFAVRIGRDDGDDQLGGVSMDLPEGLLAKIQGVEQCADTRAAVGACAPNARVGTATVGAGPGSSPFFLEGPVYLTGPYKGAPLGLAVVIRALAGPYDLGTVVVRQALHVDPVDASVRVVSDPFPTILEGVPLRLRSVNVDADRKGFTVNPTSCADKQVAGQVTATTGATAGFTRPFNAADCRALEFEPKLALRLTGRGRSPGSHPGLKAVLTQPVGQANLDKVRVELPSSLALDPDNARALCSYEDGLKAACSAESKIGTARAHSPLLNRPLTGRVHFVQGVRFDEETGNRIRTLPTLLVKLRGEIAIDLRAKSSVSGKRLVSTFSDIPDAAVSKFSMRLRSGRGGILAVTGERDLCSVSRQALVETDAQNGRRRDFVAKMKSPCRKPARR